MSPDQSPETTPEDGPVSDPLAPWGHNPRTGKPYQRDPAPFAKLRGKPFGSQNGAPSPSAPKPRGKSSSGRPRAAASTAPLKLDVAGYAAKFTAGFRAFGKAVCRKAPYPGIIIATRAGDMGEAWGKVAVSYPKVGRLVDKLSKGGDLSEAVGSTGLTLLLCAHAAGLTKGNPLMEDLLTDAMESTLKRFEESTEFDTMKRRMEEAAHAAQAKEEVATREPANA